MARAGAVGSAACLLLAGCSSVVAGSPTPVHGAVTDATDAQFPVGLAGDDEVDRLSRNTLADAVAFWRVTYPEVYAGPFEDLAGGYWSVHPSTTTDDDLPERLCADVDYVAQVSALYCPGEDAIVYNAESLADSASVIGPLVIGSTMAHELGHAVQHRSGASRELPSLVLETQAECFAGAWSRWIAAGHGSHSTLRAAELDLYLEGYRFFGDPAGSNPRDRGAHGSAFDQMAAFQVGWAGGAAACRDEFTEDRLFTLTEFTPEDEDTGGNLPLAGAIAAAGDLLPAFWTAATAGELPGSEAFEGDVELPVLSSRGPPACDRDAEELQVTWCPGDGGEPPRVGADSDAVLEPAYDDLGDFAVVTLLALPYALAVTEQLGLAADGSSALARAACTVGWLARTFFSGQLPGVELSLSSGDVDEAALVLLDAAEDPALVPAPELPAYQVVDAFRLGFEDGGPACAP